MVAAAKCGCAQARRRDAYIGVKGRKKGLNLEFKSGMVPSDVVKCLLCDDPNKAQSTQDTVQAIKEHVRAREDTEWLVIVELPLTVHTGSAVHRADLTLIPRQAQTLKDAVVVEIDPAIHYGNPTRHRLKHRRGENKQEEARDAAMQRDEFKDIMYKRLGVHLVRAEEGFLDGKTLNAVLARILDAALDAAVASVARSTSAV